LHLVLAKPLVGAIHVAHDDGDVLEVPVVAAGVDGRRAPPRRHEFRELDVLFAEAHSRGPHPEAKDAGKVLVVLAVHLDFGDLLKIEHAGVELDGTIEIRHRQSDRVHSFDQRMRTGEKQAAGQQQCAEETGRH